MQINTADHLTENYSEISDSEPQNPRQDTNSFSKKIAVILALVMMIGLLAISILFLMINPSSELLSTESENIKFVSLLSETQNYSNQLRFNGLVIPYPEGWIPILGQSQKGYNSVIYLATSAEEASYLSNCVLLDTCEEYSVKLLGLGSMGISRYGRSNDVSSEVLIAERQPDLNINELQKIGMPDKTTWSGYTNEEQSEHTMVITSSEVATGSAYYLMTSSTTQASKKYLQEFIVGLDKLQVTPQSDYQPESLNPKIAYNLDIKSSYITEDTFAFTNIMQTFLAPKGIASNYDYFLYKGYTDVYTNPPTQGEFARTGLLNSTYYLLTDNDQLEDQTFKTPQFNITVKKHENPNLGMYLADRKFCMADSDCNYRPDTCTMGAYNAFTQVNRIFGCGPSSYEGFSKEENEKFFYCLHGADITYDDIKCINSSCKLINPAGSCATEKP